MDHCKERYATVTEKQCQKCWASTWERCWTGKATKGRLKKRFGTWSNCRKENCYG